MATKTRRLDSVGYIKYTGRDVEKGVIDAGSAGSALLGLDEALRYFNLQQSPDFGNLQYDIPVKTRQGSWEAVVLGGIITIGGTFGVTYAKKAAEKLAENDFKDVSLKPVFKKSMAALQTLAKLVKHSHRTRGWETTRFSMDNPDAEVVVLNHLGEKLKVPLEYFRWYQQMPPRLLLRMTSVVRAERVLTIGLTGDLQKNAVLIAEQDKHFFDDASDEEDDDEVMFPELVHGKAATLTGRLIRGSEASNSIGLEYEGHIINCIPVRGNVRQYKAALFLRCKVSGRITRHAKSRFVAERRPTLIVEKVLILEKDVQGNLFDA
jgi:hypothetical protein